jgi:hypothetical protein
MRSKNRQVQVRGEQHGRAKLKESDVLEILRRYSAGGVTQKALAEEYGVHPVYLNKVLKGKKWAHLKT